MNRTTPPWTVIFALFLLAATPAHTADIQKLTVGKQGDTYTAKGSVFLQPPPGRVLKILTNFAQLHRLSSDILESEIIKDHGDGKSIVRLKISACLFLFCYSTTTLQAMQVAGGEIRVRLFPHPGDFKSGTVHWIVQPKKGGTQVSYNTALRPDFWVPPLIGPYVIKHKLRQNTLETFNILEKLAKEGS